MGVNKNKLYYLKRLVSFNFILTQGFWGYKKSVTNSMFNSHMLGLKDCHTIFKSDLFLEYVSRCCTFCSSIVFNKGNVTFSVPYKHKCSIKELAIYFSLRSLQSFYFNDKVDFQLINDINKNFCIVIMPSVIKEELILKKFLVNLIPFIYIEDNNFNFNRGVYPIIGNNNSIYFIFSFYKTISYSILKSMFLFRFKDI